MVFRQGENQPRSSFRVMMPSPALFHSVADMALVHHQILRVPNTKMDVTNAPFLAFDGEHETVRRCLYAHSIWEMCGGENHAEFAVPQDSGIHKGE